MVLCGWVGGWREMALAFYSKTHTQRASENAFVAVFVVRGCGGIFISRRRIKFICSTKSGTERPINQAESITGSASLFGNMIYLRRTHFAAPLYFRCARPIAIGDLNFQTALLRSCDEIICPSIIA